MFTKAFIILALVFMITLEVNDGPLAYTACQAACATRAAVVAGAGDFSTTLVAVAAYSACKAGCAALLSAPMP
uniref:Uncharacterized protein n=1 Tax=Panagrolaimus sp. ES5 TaxID=591445 RepID=A0AC34FYG1_9BILA